MVSQQSLTGDLWGCPIHVTAAHGLFLQPFLQCHGQNLVGYFKQKNQEKGQAIILHVLRCCGLCLQSVFLLPTLP